MVRASDIFEPGELAALKRKSDWRGAWLIVHAWAVIFGAMACFVWWPNPVSFILAVLVIAGRQLGLAILMHDAAHKLLFANAQANDRIAAWFCAYPVIADLARYRPYHLSHHRHVQSAEDPDLVLSAPFPTTAASFRRKVLRDLTGQTALKQRGDQLRAARRAGFWRVLYGPILANAALFLLLADFGHWWLYPALWLVPLFTVYQLLTRIRNIAEHAMVPDNADDFRNARTTLAGRLERVLVAPYWVNYHVEHHVLMFVPCYRLPQARALLLAKGYGARIETQPGYATVLRMATSKAA
ncbi:MAG: fatty acid desaturase family protein, partial [Aliidongia sp.]